MNNTNGTETWSRFVDASRDFLAREVIGGNNAGHLLGFVAAAMAGLIAGRIARRAIHRVAASLEARSRTLSAVTARTLARCSPLVGGLVGTVVGLRLGILRIDDDAAATLEGICMGAAIGIVAYRMVDVVDAWLQRFAAKTTSKLDDMLVPLVGKAVRGAVFVLVLMMLIAPLVPTKQLASLIAGLGVGGLAVALAAQETLRNLFGSLMIFSDRPFEVGDRIVVDGHDGPVESVGFRSTRIRTLEGHVVTIPNGELANKTIRNIAPRPNIRRIMNLGITYDTPPEKVDRALEIVRELLDNHEGMDPGLPPRAYFNEFNDSALNLFVMYWYHPPDWWAFCEFNQRVNSEILRRYNAEGIEFAFPSQTVYLAGQSGEA